MCNDRSASYSGNAHSSSDRRSRWPLELLCTFDEPIAQPAADTESLLTPYEYAAYIEYMQTPVDCSVGSRFYVIDLQLFGGLGFQMQCVRINRLLWVLTE